MSSDRLKQATIDIAAGTVAGINVTLVGHPFDTMKVKMQMFPGEYKGFFDCLQSIIKKDGIFELYKGVQSPILGQMFFRALMFLSAAESRRQFSDNGRKPLEIWQYYAAGSIGWGIGALAECPIDVVKCQMQVQRNLMLRGFPQQYKGTLDCYSQILKQRGIKGFYQGIIPHLMRNIPAGGVHIGTYEYSLSLYAKEYKKEPSQIPLLFKMAAGSFAGCLYWAPFFPLDVVKNVIQSQNIHPEKREYNGYLNTFTKLYQEHGWKRFYAGIAPCMVRAVPANAVLLVTVTETTGLLKRTFPDKQLQQ